MIENLKTMITHGGDIDTGRYGERLGGGGLGNSNTQTLHTVRAAGVLRQLYMGDSLQGKAREEAVRTS